MANTVQREGIKFNDSEKYASFSPKSKHIIVIIDVTLSWEMSTLNIHLCTCDYNQCSP